MTVKVTGIREGFETPPTTIQDNGQVNVGPGINATYGGDDGAYGVQADYDSKEWDVSLSSNHVEQNFSPELGFVRHTGVRENSLRASRT